MLRGWFPSSQGGQKTARINASQRNAHFRLRQFKIKHIRFRSASHRQNGRFACKRGPDRRGNCKCVFILAVLRKHLRKENDGVHDKATPRESKIQVTPPSSCKAPNQSRPVHCVWRNLCARQNSFHPGQNAQLLPFRSTAAQATKHFPHAKLIQRAALCTVEPRSRNAESLDHPRLDIDRPGK